MNEESSPKIIDFDPQFIDQHIEIRDTILQKIPFRTEELMMDADQLKAHYTNPLNKPSKIIRYAVHDDELVGFISCNINNSILLHLNCTELDQEVDLQYPMVRTGEKEVLQQLLENLISHLANEGMTEVKCGIAKNHQFSEEMIAKYFNFEKAVFRVANIPINQEYDLPTSDRIREMTEADSSAVVKHVAEGYHGQIPEPAIQEAVQTALDNDFPNIVYEEEGEISGWISVKPNENDPKVAELQMPFINVDEDYVNRSTSMLHQVLQELKSHDTIDILRVRPMFRPDVFDVLNEAKIPIDLQMANYTVDFSKFG